MKKLFISFVCVILSQISYAQIFTEIKYYDKFDDSLKEEMIKTLITKTDSTFIIEEKGRKPKEYWILNYAPFASLGSRDSIVDLTGKNVYGYQDCWCVIKMSDKDELFRIKNKMLNDNENPSSDEIGKLFNRFYLFLIHRTISRYSFEFEYKNELIWIENGIDDDKLGRDVNRIIYLK